MLNYSVVFFKVFTDFLEIRDEIEKETERSSGDNKVTYILMYGYAQTPFIFFLVLEFRFRITHR